VAAIVEDCPTCSYPLQSNGCSNCRQEQAKIRKAGIAALGGVRAFEDFTADAFKPSPLQWPALEAAKAFDPLKDNLYICGPVGAGKSHLATIAARRFLGKFVVRTLTPFEISRQVRGAGSGRDELDVVRGIADAKILVIDDMGTAKDTEFLVGLIYEIVNFRYLNHRGGLIVTSNLKPSELGEKMGDDRIVSRLIQLCKIIQLTGERDHRIPTP
jgi:DNA replication protein DnaC